MFRLTLKAARVNANLSQEQVAENLKISNKTVSNWENGISMPKADQINALCHLYGVTYDMLIFLPLNPLKADCNEEG